MGSKRRRPYATAQMTCALALGRLAQILQCPGMSTDQTWKARLALWGPLLALPLGMLGTSLYLHLSVPIVPAAKAPPQAVQPPRAARPVYLALPQAITVSVPRLGRTLRLSIVLALSPDIGYGLRKSLQDAPERFFAPLADVVLQTDASLPADAPALALQLALPPALADMLNQQLQAEGAPPVVQEVLIAEFLLSS